jgi:hypothetical protein
MEQQRSADSGKNKDNSIGGVQTNAPDPQEQNDTGFAGTTNAVSENHQEKEGYKIAIEDTMIGYDGDDSQMDMDLGDEDKRRTGKSGVDDND